MWVFAMRASQMFTQTSYALKSQPGFGMWQNLMMRRLSAAHSRNGPNQIQIAYRVSQKRGNKFALLLGEAQLCLPYVCL